MTLDKGLISAASARGEISDVLAQALRLALDPQEAARRRRWIEDHALLIEAGRGAAEAE